MLPPGLKLEKYYYKDLAAFNPSSAICAFVASFPNGAAA
jgi:hypothetical protein